MRRPAFTLVELMIVLMVISILSIVITGAAVGAIKKAKTHEIALNLEGIVSAAMNCLYTEDVDPEDLSLDFLLSKGYLDKSPDGDYGLDITCDSAKCTVKALYHGSVPSPDELEEILKGVETGSDGAAYSIDVPMW